MILALKYSFSIKKCKNSRDREFIESDISVRPEKDLLSGNVSLNGYSSRLLTSICSAGCPLHGR